MCFFSLGSLAHALAHEKPEFQREKEQYQVSYGARPDACPACPSASPNFERDADGACLRWSRNNIQLREERRNGIVNGFVAGLADDDGFGYLAVFPDGEFNNRPGGDLASEFNAGWRNSVPLGLDERIQQVAAS